MLWGSVTCHPFATHACTCGCPLWKTDTHLHCSTTSYHSHAGHVTKPVNDELKKCLSSDVNDGFVFPLELERATLQEWEPVAQNMLLPLCRHLKSLATEMEDTGNSETEYDSGVFKWL